MEYKKVIKDSLTYHLIKSDRFKSINVVIYFTKKFNENDVVFNHALADMLVYSTKKHNTKEKIVAYCEDLYGAKVSASSMITGGLEAMSFALSFINPKYTSPSLMDKSLDLLKEVLLEPNAKDNKFDLNVLRIVSSSSIARINSIKDNPSNYASVEYSKLMYRDVPSRNSFIPKVEDVKKITEKNLYENYLHLFDGTYKVNICVHGEVNDDIIDKLHDRFSSIKSNNKKLKFTVKTAYDNKIHTKIDTLPFNQSKLFMGYKLDDMTYHEYNHVLKLYNTILGTMNDSLLFNIVREQNSLCYVISSYTVKYHPSLTIFAGINKENYKKSVELIKKCVSLMKDRNIILKYIDNAKKTINTILNSYYDEVTSQIYMAYTNSIEYEETIEEERENINKVTIDEIININSKLHLDTIYFLKGDYNE